MPFMMQESAQAQTQVGGTPSPPSLVTRIAEKGMKSDMGSMKLPHGPCVPVYSKSLSVTCRQRCSDGFPAQVVD
jgi:hypothetical protein